MPANFDASRIAEVDDSSADKLAQTLAIAIMERADTLRQPVCFFIFLHMALMLRHYLLSSGLKTQLQWLSASPSSFIYDLAI